MIASNDNHSCNAREACTPYLELRSTGDGRALARALARVIVRQELKFATSIDERPGCGLESAA